MVWRPIPGFKYHSVSDSGKVRRDEPPFGILNQHPNTGGYPTVYISERGKRHARTVHKLVCLAFLGPAPKGLQVAHNDGDKTNNRLDNLRYDTPRGNSQDRIKHGTQVRGSKQHLAKLNEAAVKAIRDCYASGYANQYDLADIWGMSQSSIGSIIRGETWSVARHGAPT